MATLASITSGNFTDSATWGLVDSTSFLDSRATATVPSTSYQGSSTFIPGAITVQGVCIQLAGRANPASGTLSVQLYNSTTSTAISTVTINVSDLPDSIFTSTGNLGWIYFKFGASVTLVAGQSYQIRILTSVANMVSVYVSATTNWSRALVTTTTQAPAASDVLIIGGEYTAAGVNAMYTVTMDSTSSAVLYGTTYIGGNGYLNYGVSASTNYKLAVAGDIWVNGGGRFDIGSTGARIPSTSTATLEISCASAGQYALRIASGTFNAFGSQLTYTQAKLAADAATGATASTTNVPTGWQNGDLVIVTGTAIGSTGDLVTVSGSTGTTLNHTAFNYLHGGNPTTLIQADLGNLTRNVKIFSTSSTNRSLISVTGLSATALGVFTADSVQMYDLGTTTLSGSSGINANAFSSVSIDGSSMYASLYGSTITGGCTLVGSTGTLTVNNSVFYGMGYAISNVAAVTTATATNCLVARCAQGIYLVGYGNFSSINVANCSYAVYLSRGSFGSGWGSISFEMTAINGYGGSAFLYPSGYFSGTGTFTNCRAWRCSEVFPYVSFFFQSRQSYLKFKGLYAFSQSNFLNTNVVIGGTVMFEDSYFWDGATCFTYGTGSINFVDSFYFNNCVFGKDYLGNTNAFTTAVINIAYVSSGMTVNMNNCSFTGTVATVRGGNTGFGGNYGFYMANSFVSLNHNGVTGSHFYFSTAGRAQTDTTYFSTSSPSLRITPGISNPSKVRTPCVRVPVKSGTSATISVKVRKSAAPDTVYNGSQPRLMYALNYSSGNQAETVGATASNAANGAWETLTYSTPSLSSDAVLEFYVDCDGSAGFVNVDDWSTNSFVDTKGTAYWGNIGVYSEPDYRTPGGNYTFIS